MFQATVTNELINGRNLGTYHDPETGDAVPVGGMK